MTMEKLIRLLAFAVCLTALPSVGREIFDGGNPPLGALVTPHRVETVADGLRVPWELAFLPGGDAIFTERPGRVRLIRGGRLVERPALELEVALGNKMGMLGLALDPGFVGNRLVHIAYNRQLGEGRFELRVERYRLDGGRLVEPMVLLEGIRAWSNHTGCRLLFGPDGMMWVATGDANEPPLCQRLDNLSGKILRIRPDGGVPDDNPFVGRPGVRPEIWSWGHRNPQGIAFQPGTGRLYASEHGPQHGDELNRITRGANYGWPTISHRRTAPGLEAPIIEITPAVGPGKLIFYQGAAFPELRGCLLMATLRGAAVQRIALDGDGFPVAVDRLFHAKWGRIRFITEAPDGSLWLGTSMHDPPEGQPGDGDDRILRVVADPHGTIERLDGPATVEPVPVAPGPGVIDPARLITFYCAACHGSGLRGGLQRDLLDGDWKHARGEMDLERLIGEGLPAAGMPGNRGLLTGRQIGILADFIRAGRAPRR